MPRSRTAFVIMAGGRGERLWPLVCASVPKVCVSVDGKRTLLENTLARLRAIDPRAQTLIVTTAPQARAIERVLGRASKRQMLIEPQPKNTAACIALAAQTLAERDPHLVMAVVPADHWIKPLEAFRRSMRAAIDAAAASDQLVTIGLRPTRVHPGLGHLCAGRLEGVRHGCRVLHLRRFVEKPSPRLAQRLMAQGPVYWNSGCFVGRVTTFLDCIQEALPDHARRLFPLAGATTAQAFIRRASAAYRLLRAVSFDDGVMAYLKDGLIVEGAFAWEDLGSWDSWVRISPTVDAALTLRGEGVRVVSRQRHLVATVGLQDAIVVHTPNATLICRADHAQGVREIASRLARDPQRQRYL